MGKLVLLNTRIFAGAADLTSNSNSVELSSEIEEKDTTPFGSDGWKESLGGLGSTEIKGAGQWDNSNADGAVDPRSWGDLVNRRHVPWTVCPESAAVGELAYNTDALRTEYKLGDAVGEVAPWEASAVGNSPLLRGTIGHAPSSVRTVSGDEAGVELGAVSSEQRLFAGLHVLSVSGTTPTLDVEIESDADNTFASPTTRIAFTQATTAIGTRGQFLSAVGPITDTWFRVAWAIAGTSPSFQFVVTLAIA